ncbi:MAG TPA: preprotein translocase subunit SecG [Bacteroidia bacterium]|nr:preprotein translocase subunit SecG [Bacteroidia bacterium]
MSGIISILIIVVCVLLALIVLIQNSKGGGLSSSFASNNQIMGVRRTADVLEKTTWGFAIALFVLCLLGTPKRQVADANPASGTESVTRRKAETMAPAAAPIQQQAPVTQPAQPQQAPAQQQTPPAPDKK